MLGEIKKFLSKYKIKQEQSAIGFNNLKQGTIASDGFNYKGQKECFFVGIYQVNNQISDD